MAYEVASSPLVLAVTIEGHGSGGQQYVYCTDVPDFAEGNPLYRPWIRDGSWPTVLTEKVDAGGGIPDPALFHIDLVDLENQITSEWRTNRAPTTLLSASEIKTTSPTTFDFRDGGAINIGDQLWVGSECIKVTSKPTTDSAICTRAQNGTDEQAHAENVAVYQSIPEVFGRRLNVYVIPRDATAWTVLWTGAFFIDKIGLGKGLGSWKVRAKSDLRPVARQIGNDTPTGELGPLTTTTKLHLWFRRLDLLSSLDPWDDNEAWVKVGKEILLVEADETALFNEPLIKRRGELGTRQVDLKIGDKFSYVYAAHETGPCVFRHSPLNKTVRSDPDWRKTAHPADIMLCFLTSSQKSSDGLELTNGDATYGNWSGLPVGLGMGIPIDEIDVASFVAFRDSTDYLRFPFFWQGEDPREFAAVVIKHFLKPLRAFLSTIDGKLTLRYPTLPLPDAPVTEWTDPLSRPAGKRVREPIFDADLSRELFATSVKYVVTGRNGEKDSVIFNDAEFEAWGAQPDYHARTDRTVTFEVPGVSGDQKDMLNELAQRELYRRRQALWGVRTSTDYSKRASVPGDQAAHTHADMPNMADGTRGWVSVPTEILSRNVHLRPGENETRIDWKMLGYGPSLRVGRIAPSAVIESHVINGDSTATLTVTTPRYTQSDALNGLPTDDALTFVEDYVVTLINPDGSSVTSNTETVTAVIAGKVTVSGNFGGALANDKILVFTDRSATIATQHDNFVFWAGKTTSPPVIAGSTDEPWRFGG